MPTKLTFTRRPMEGIADNKDTARELKRFHKLFKRGDPVPESIWVTANTMLAERAGKLAFDTRRTYDECQREVLRREPHLRLGVTSWMPDKYFSAIEFTTEEAIDDDAS